jgi:hypothetical protein
MSSHRHFVNETSGQNPDTSPSTELTNSDSASLRAEVASPESWANEIVVVATILGDGVDEICCKKDSSDAPERRFCPK